MLESAIHDEVRETLSWLKRKNPDLGRTLDRSCGYVVFPHMGRASLQAGGATGGGEVFEQGKPIGLARHAQLTAGGQVGGQPFSELILFESKPALEAFKERPIAFMANASALVKAEVTGTGGASRRAYSRGGMLLELPLGAQKFQFFEHEFKSLEEQQRETAGERIEPPELEQLSENAPIPAEGGSRGAARKVGEDATKFLKEATRRLEETDFGSRVRRFFGGAATTAGLFLESYGAKGGRIAQLRYLLTRKGGTPLQKVKWALAGLGKESTLAPVLDKEAQAALERFKAMRPGMADAIQEAYGYAVFPIAGKASALFGGAYGHGEVFELGLLTGYAAIAQLTVGVQIGGDAFDELILFENKGALDRFKSGKMAFVTNASVAILRAGAATTSDYASDTKVFLLTGGGLILETAVGGQKFVYLPKVLGADAPRAM